MKKTMKTILLASSLCLPLLMSSGVSADDLSSNVEAPIEVPNPGTTETSSEAPIELPTQPTVPEVTESKESDSNPVTTPPSSEVPIEVPSETPKEPVTVSESSSKPVSETPKEDLGNEIKDKSDNKEPSQPVAETKPGAIKPVTIPNITTPLISATGQTVVGTQEGKVVVQAADGTTSIVSPEQIGAKNQSDGTIVLKTKDGKVEVLPKTGETELVIALYSGIFSVLSGLIMAFRKVSKKN